MRFVPSSFSQKPIWTDCMMFIEIHCLQNPVPGKSLTNTVGGTLRVHGSILSPAGIHQATEGPQDTCPPKQGGSIASHVQSFFPCLFRKTKCKPKLASGNVSHTVEHAKVAHRQAQNCRLHRVWIRTEQNLRRDPKNIHHIHTYI